ELPVLAARVVTPAAEEHVFAVGERLGAGLVGGGLRLGVIVHAYVVQIFSVRAAELLRHARLQRLARALLLDGARGHRVGLVGRRCRAAIHLPASERRVPQTTAAAAARFTIFRRRCAARPLTLFTIGH